MSIFEKLGKTLGVSSKGIDVEEYMNAAEMDDVDVMHEPADHYIKPVALQQQTDVELIKKELGSNNIILMNISEMAKRPNTLKAVNRRPEGLCGKDEWGHSKDRPGQDNTNSRQDKDNKDQEDRQSRKSYSFWAFHYLFSLSFYFTVRSERYG